MNPPKILAREQTTEDTDTYFGRVQFTAHEPELVLLRNLQTQLTASSARIDALEVRIEALENL